MSGWNAPGTAGHGFNNRFATHRQIALLALIGIALCLASAPGAAAQGTTPTSSSLGGVGGTGDPYDMSCTVEGVALTGLPGPSGTVTFTDTTTNTTLATTTLAAATTSIAFRSTEFVPTGYLGSGFGLIAEDLTGKGRSDLVWTSGGSVVVYLGNSDGSLTAEPPLNLLPLLSALSGTTVSASDLNGATGGILVGGDFNGDGKLDVAGTLDGYFFVLYGNGDGTFQTPTTANFYAGYDGPVAAGDFNGDGFTDVAVLQGANVAVFLSNAAGTISAPVISPALAEGRDPGQLIAGVFKPGTLDLALPVAGGVAVLIGNGDGTFQAPVTTEMSVTPWALAPADFNQDGKLDLIEGSNNGYTLLLLGNGDGTFQVPSKAAFQITNLDQGFTPWPILAVDINGDGFPDVVEAGEVSAEIVLGNGDGTFQPATGKSLIYGGYGGTALAAGDFNGDGRMDLASGGFDVAEGDYHVESDELSVGEQYTLATAVGTQVNIAVNAGTISTHAFDCSYSGDSNYAASVSALVPITYTQAAIPIFQLNVGNYATSQRVSIADSTGKTIYYTTDGSTPTTSSTLYTAPITVSTTETLKAIAAPLGFSISPVSEAVYTITDPPSVSLPGGTYPTQQSVTLTDGTSGAVIYYTTDGSTPGKTSTQYTAPITIIGDVTLKAIALASGNLFSPVVTTTYSVPRETTSTAIQSSTLNAAENQKITLTATVTGDSPTGTITFSSGANSLGTATLASGVATLPVSFANAGSYQVTATYSGDAVNAASTSSVVTVVVAQATTTTAIKASSGTASPGKSITLTATVKGNSPTGKVTFTAGTQTLGSATLASGVATLPYSFTSAGTFTVIAAYGGDANNAASTSGSVAVIVAQAASSTALAASSSSPDENQKITLTATVTGYKPTGTVAFSTGTTSLGSGTLAGGIATVQASFAAAGSYPITAAYSGDANNLASTSSSVTLVVATPTFAVASSPTSRTVSAGQSASYDFTVTPANGYTGTVNLSCGTLPKEANCSFSASAITITGSGAGKSTLTISTTAPTVSRNTAPASPFAPWRTGGTMALAGILGLTLAPRKMRGWNRRFRASMCIALLGALWLPLVGCGGGGGMTHKTGGTPSGTYTVTVAAADSGGGSSTTARVTLIVQ